MRYSFHFACLLLLWFTCVPSDLFLNENCSGSMEPTFQRGDILFLDNGYDTPMAVGEIVVFKLKGRDIPIVHRIHRVYEKCVASCTAECDRANFVHFAML